MKAGITFTHNGDLMYVGPKRNQQDITDAVISWADNAFAGEVGPDVLRFLFTDRSNGSTAISSNPLNAQDYDGVEVARMTGDAKMGVGPMWTNEFLPHNQRITNLSSFTKLQEDAVGFMSSSYKGAKIQ